MSLFGKCSTIHAYSSEQFIFRGHLCNPCTYFYVFSLSFLFSCSAVFVAVVCEAAYCLSLLECMTYVNSKVIMTLLRFASPPHCEVGHNTRHDIHVHTIYSFIVGTHKSTPLILFFEKEKQPTTMKETPAACSSCSAPLTSIVSLFYSISVHYYKYNIIIIMIIIYKQDLFCSSGIHFHFWPLEMEKNTTVKF